MIIYLTRTLNGFSVESIEDLKSYKIGETYKAKITKPRNYEFHKKFFAFVHFCYYHMPDTLNEIIKSEEDMLDFIKIGVGHCKSWITPKGDKVYIPKSISFAKMDGAEFDKFYRECLDFVCKHILKGLDEETINNELIHFT